jgi:DNA-binding transcriptional ArsR family regulator
MARGPHDDVPRLDTKTAKGFAHPIRVRLLKALNHRHASVSELAKQLRLADGAVDYHIGVLRDCDCIQVATTRKRMGRDVKFYTAKPNIFYSAPHIEAALMRTSASAAEFPGFLEKSQSAIDAGAVEPDGGGTFVVEALTLTEPHRRTAEEAIHLTVANLRTLHEQSRELNVAIDAPVCHIELGIAMFSAPEDEGEPL